MTTKDEATIQDASADLWHLSGSDLLVLANVKGEVFGFQSGTQGFSRERVQRSLHFSLAKGDAWDWWFDGQNLYQIWIQPIYFGDQSQNSLLGFLALGHGIGESEAHNFGNVASSEMVFLYGGDIAASTLSSEANATLAQRFREGKDDRRISLVELGSARR